MFSSLQDDCNCPVLWPRWAGVSGEVPVRGLWIKHHVFTQAHERDTVMCLRMNHSSSRSHVVKQKPVLSVINGRRWSRYCRENTSGLISTFQPERYTIIIDSLAQHWRFCLDRQKHFRIFWEKGWQQQNILHRAANTQTTLTTPLQFYFFPVRLFCNVKQRAAVSIRSCSFYCYLALCRAGTL